MDEIFNYRELHCSTTYICMLSNLYSLVDNLCLLENIERESLMDYTS